MMSLKEVLAFIKTLDVKFDHYYFGILDSKKDKSLGVYNLKESRSQIMALGGIENSSYNVKAVSLLIHYNDATDESEKKAIDLYNELLKPVTTIGEHTVQFIRMLENSPIDVGRDEKGICEYVIEFEIYYRRR